MPLPPDDTLFQRYADAYAIAPLLRLIIDADEASRAATSENIEVPAATLIAVYGAMRARC